MSVSAVEEKSTWDDIGIDSGGWLEVIEGVAMKKTV